MISRHTLLSFLQLPFNLILARSRKGDIMRSRFLKRWTSALLGTCIVLLGGVPLVGQTTPPEGIRTNTPAVHAFINARIISSPGKIVENGTLIIRDGVIQSVGTTAPPPDARIWDMKGLTIYPGFIDAYSDYGIPSRPEGKTDTVPRPSQEARGAAYWNKAVAAQKDAAELFLPDPERAEKLRTQGFTSALIVPAGGIFKGRSAVVNLGNGKPNELILRSNVAQHVKLGANPSDETYPSSLMGAIALIRQVLLDADWYRKAHEAFTQHPSLPRPEVNEPLAALEGVLTATVPIVIETADEFDILRAHKIAQEFSLNLMVRGNGQEYKRLDAVKATGRPILLPVNFPDVPSVQRPEEALQVTLSELSHWDEAPENPGRLYHSGVQFAFTSAMLKDAGAFLSQVRAAVERGLPRDAALGALTTTPARLFGVEQYIGSLEPGKSANFIVTSADLFAKKTVIRETWIDGKRYELKPPPESDPRGTWNVKIAGLAVTDTLRLTLKGDADSLRGTFSRGRREVKFTAVNLSGSSLSLVSPSDSIGFPGIVRMSATVGALFMAGSGDWSNGETFVWSATRGSPFTPETDTAKPRPPVMASFPPVYPPGEFGRKTIPEQPATVLVRGATIWTCGPGGKLEDADLLVEKGRIISVGRHLSAPSKAMIIEGTGKHVTPGIIDAHSHTAGFGGVNEAGQAISAETRIGDVIDADDIDIYRELAGGLTVAHVLHGSANPIGGQCQLIKLRWGSLPDEMAFSGAPPTIKFALGENVKQSNWGDRFTTRYPQTRMGVEQLIRDEFQAALDYEKSQQRYSREGKGIPPRRDLELEAILEVLRGKRFIHCHAYRQDEILMLMRVAEDFGFRVRTFQHILEGYKVADAMAKHGASASSFSDWWAYKLEVYDAIPYNGALMYDQGVLVSFNSDSDELARRLNLEAAKAVKYGGVPEEEALKFVTLNPAKQLMVDNRVGSLEQGKDADFVIWNGNPLSTFTLCEQTWIDGRRYFDREEDRLLNETARQQRATLIQKALTSRKAGGGKTSEGRGEFEDANDHPDGVRTAQEVRR
jgi:imidazolonepropionase-like amidohydrolase